MPETYIFFRPQSFFYLFRIFLTLFYLKCKNPHNKNKRPPRCRLISSADRCFSGTAWWYQIVSKCRWRIRADRSGGFSLWFRALCRKLFRMRVAIWILIFWGPERMTGPELQPSQSARIITLECHISQLRSLITLVDYVLPELYHSEDDYV